MSGTQERPSLLDPALVQAYWRDGFVIVRRVFDSVELESFAQEYDRLWSCVDVSRENPRVQWRHHQEGGDVADRLDPILDISPTFRQVASSSPLRSMATDLLGSDAALMKGKIIDKRAGTAGYKMHQDYPYWEFLEIDADRMLTLQVMLGSGQAQTGATEAFPGCHHGRIAAPESDPFDSDESRIDLASGVLLEMEPGDVLALHSLTPHRSAPNRGDRHRRSVLFSYAVVPPGDDIEQRYYTDPRRLTP